MGFYMLACIAGCRWDDRALLSEVTLTGSLGHAFRRLQFIAPNTRGPASPVAHPHQKGRIVSRSISAFAGRFRDKWGGYVLNLLAATLRTIRMSGFMFSEMFGVLEHLTALLAAVLVSRHVIPPMRISHVVLARSAPPGSVVPHSSAGNARVRASGNASNPG